MGIAWALDVPQEMVLSQLQFLPTASHRSELTETERGVAIVDDTYNSNPPGAQRAIKSAGALAKERGGSLYVVTPGMVELGSLQYHRNKELAQQVAHAGGTLYAVGLTNRKALVDGSSGAQLFLTRDEAVGAVNQVASSGDVILYENDLPDHYP
jgi:UDP-N-acetylmuramoyl-tripeptide--D-alanyl-D-alanine ligase